MEISREHGRRSGWSDGALDPEGQQFDPAIEFAHEFLDAPLIAPDQVEGGLVCGVHARMLPSISGMQ